MGGTIKQETSDIPASEGPESADSSDTERSESDLFCTDHLIPDLGGRSVRGGVVTFLAQVAKFFLQTVSTMVVARILTPADFGLVAIVTIVTGFVAIFGEAGLSMATIQREKISHGQISTLFWVNVAFGFLLTVGTLLLAPVISKIYDEPRLTNVTFVIALNFVIVGTGVQHRALLCRQMRFNTLAIIDVMTMVVSVAVSILAALVWRNYWALVVSPLAGSLAYLVASWIAAGWWPGWPRKGTGVRGSLSYGLNLSGASFLTYCSQNMDYLALGYLWGPGPLGLYRKSYELLMLPVRQINVPVAKVMLPALSRLQNDGPRFERAYVRSLRLLALSGTPLIGVVFVEAELVINILLGPQWIETVPIFRCFFPAALFATIYSMPGFLFMALDRTDRQLRASVVETILLAVGVASGVAWGGVTLAISVSVATVVSFVWKLWYACAGTPVSFTRVLWEFFPFVLATGALILSAIAFKESSSMGLWSERIVEAIVGAVFYIATLLMFQSSRESLRDAVSICKSGLKMKGAAGKFVGTAEAKDS